VDLSRVIIGHSGDTTDLASLKELIANGSYLGMDRFGIDSILPFEDRVTTVAEMCKRGHTGKMVLRTTRSATTIGCRSGPFPPCSPAGTTCTFTTTFYLRCGGRVSANNSCRPCWWKIRRIFEQQNAF
jgi:hypothetical protein